MTSGRNSYNR